MDVNQFFNQDGNLAASEFSSNGAGVNNIMIPASMGGASPDKQNWMQHPGAMQPGNNGMIDLPQMAYDSATGDAATFRDENVQLNG